MAETSDPNITGNLEEWLLTLDRLKTFEYDGVNYRKDLEPVQQNLFWAGDFWERNPDSNEDKTADKWGRHFINAPFRITSVKVPLPKLDYDVHPYLKTSFLKSVTYDNTITVTWLEDVYRSVQKFHLDWVHRWYNRQYDVLRNGPQGKFKQLDVYAFHYVNTTGALLEAPRLEVLFRIKLRGLMPRSLGELTFDYGAPGNETPVSIQYSASKVLWEYNPSFYDSNFRNVFKADGAWLSKKEVVNNVWNPTGDGGDTIPSSTDAANQTEGMRVITTITPSIVGEGEIS